LSQTDRERFAQIADMLIPHLRPEFRVVDVGCATGGLLAELKGCGFEHVRGLDPSPACAAVAKQLYGIDVEVGNIRDLKAPEGGFDTAVLIGVFEHLPELDDSINSLKKNLKPGGLLYLEVPDAGAYWQHFSAPYQFLSIEHVNFFSPVSLRNLLARHGFECVFARQVPRHLGPNSIEPGVAALFSLTGKAAPPQLDQETEPALAKYLDTSRRLEAEIHEKIARVAESRVPTAVWGAGTHTLRLLETSKLPAARIVAIIDSNVRYKGKKLRGIPIVAPDEFHQPEATIIISSQVAESEIKAQIQNQLGWTNPLICFYENAPGRN
jgi:SAM-dependent methyltransferase